MEIALFIIQILTLIALIIYVIKTWEMASATNESAKAAENTLVEMKETRDQESAPYVIVYFDVPHGKSFVYLVIKNIGKSMAKDVRLNFHPSLKTSDINNLENMPLFSKGIASLAPEQEIRVLLDATISFFGEPGLPLTYELETTYHGGIKDDPRLTKHTLDLSPHKGLMYIQSKDIDDLNKTIEKVLKEQNKIRQSLESISKNLEGGIFLNNPSLTISSISSDGSEWRAILIAKLQEFLMMWESSSSDEIKRQQERLNMQSRILLIGSQILTILSIKPTDNSQELATQALNIATEMQVLGRRKPYMDGGVQKYFADGDKLANQISALVSRAAILTPKS